jgi:transposase
LALLRKLQSALTRIEDGVMRLSAAQLSALLSGMEWTRVHTPRVIKPDAVQ